MSHEETKPASVPVESAIDEEERFRQRVRRRLREHQELTLWMRALLFLVGWLLVLVGILGLVLPGIQGVLTLVAGAAVLSLVSEIAYKVMRWCFQRWPRGWRRVAKWRKKLHAAVGKLGGHRRPSRHDRTSTDRERDP